MTVTNYDEIERTLRQYYDTRLRRPSTSATTLAAWLKMNTRTEPPSEDKVRDLTFMSSYNGKLDDYDAMGVTVHDLCNPLIRTELTYHVQKDLAIHSAAAGLIWLWVPTLMRGIVAAIATIKSNNPPTTTEAVINDVPADGAHPSPAPTVEPKPCTPEDPTFYSFIGWESNAVLVTSNIVALGMVVWYTTLFLDTSNWGKMEAYADEDVNCGTVPQEFPPFLLYGYLDNQFTQDECLTFLKDSHRGVPSSGAKDFQLGYGVVFNVGLGLVGWIWQGPFIDKLCGDNGACTIAASVAINTAITGPLAITSARAITNNIWHYKMSMCTGGYKTSAFIEALKYKSCDTTTKLSSCVPFSSVNLCDKENTDTVTAREKHDEVNTYSTYGITMMWAIQPLVTLAICSKAHGTYVFTPTTQTMCCVGAGDIRYGGALTVAGVVPTLYTFCALDDEYNYNTQCCVPHVHNDWTDYVL